MAFSVKDRKATLTLLQQDLQTCSDEERKQKIHSIQMLYALEKFHEKSYSQAMAEFLRLNADPVEVIKLFPQLNRYTGKKWNFIKEKQHAISFLIWYLQKLQIRLNGEQQELSGSEEDPDKLRNVQERLEVVNTTLLKWYLLTNNDELLPHIEKNVCNFSITEKLLRRHEKIRELLILYKKNGLHKKALHYLKAEAKKQEQSSYRFDEIIKYMEDLGPEQIGTIIQFSDWILKENPHRGVKIFTEDLIEAKNLPRTEILNYLLSENKMLAIHYLEHVIHKWKDTSNMFHETLINLYIELIVSKQSDIVIREKEELHYRLLIFLELSMNYDPQKVIMNIPKDGFLEEKAILFGKMGKYEDGIVIYLFLLQDLDKAIQYCEKMYSSCKNAQNIYLTLVKLLLKRLKQGDSKLFDIDTVFDVIENNANKISAVDVLPELPDSAPLHKLKSFLVCALEAQFAMKQHMRIYRSLALLEYLKMPELKRKAEDKRFEVTIDIKCSVCKRPFGNQKWQAPFVRYPDGEMIHILCNSELQKKEPVVDSSKQ